MRRRVHPPLSDTPPEVKPKLRRGPKPGVKKLIGAGTKTTMPISMETRARSYERQRLTIEYQAMQLKLFGHDVHSIAEKLSIMAEDVPAMLLAGLAEYRMDRDDAIKKYLSLADARYDRIYRTYMPLMEERREKVMQENEDGDMEEVEVIHPPDPEAARIVLKAQADQARMYGLNKVRVEHTGANGGAISVHASMIGALSIEQLERVSKGDYTVFNNPAALPIATSSDGAVGAEEAPSREESPTPKHH